MTNEPLRTSAGRLTGLQSLIFLLSDRRSRARVGGEQRIRGKRLRKPESLLVFTINLNNFTFSLAARGSEERKTTARGV